MPRPTNRQIGIPKGPYCYDKNGLCPHWARRTDKTEHDCGYCGFMDRGDWEVEGLSLLWDQVKECNLHRDEEADG